MAGDWIKWVKGLAKKREVAALASMLAVTRHEIAARLMELWEWCDDNIPDDQIDADGNATIYVGHEPYLFLDALLGLPGFAEAMASPEVRWLIARSGGRITFPNLGRHNGGTAKTRALTLKRVANHRQKDVTRAALPEREKRIESLDSPESGNSPGFQPSGVPPPWSDEIYADILQDAELIAQVVPTAGDDRLACCRIGYLVRSRLLPMVWLDQALSDYRARAQPPRKPHGWLLTKLRKSAVKFGVPEATFNERFGAEIPPALWTRVTITKGVP